MCTALHIQYISMATQRFCRVEKMHFKMNENIGHGSSIYIPELLQLSGRFEHNNKNSCVKDNNFITVCCVLRIFLPISLLYLMLTTIFLLTVHYIF